MPITRIAYAKNVEHVSVKDAVVGSLDASDHGSGRLEDLESSASATAEMLGSLISLLHDKGILSEKEIGSLLSFKYTLVD
jgi:hypothetical protein